MFASQLNYNALFAKRQQAQDSPRLKVRIKARVQQLTGELGTGHSTTWSSTVATVHAKPEATARPWGEPYSVSYLRAVQGSFCHKCIRKDRGEQGTVPSKEDKRSEPVQHPLPTVSMSNSWEQ